MITHSSIRCDHLNFWIFSSHLQKTMEIFIFGNWYNPDTSRWLIWWNSASIRKSESISGLLYVRCVWEQTKIVRNPAYWKTATKIWWRRKQFTTYIDYKSFILLVCCYENCHQGTLHSKNTRMGWLAETWIPVTINRARCPLLNHSWKNCSYTTPYYWWFLRYEPSGYTSLT